MYTRLLKSTQPGRSDYNLLLGANERLVRLLDIVDARASILVGTDHDSTEVVPLPQPKGNVPSQPLSEPGSIRRSEATDDLDLVSPLPGNGRRGVMELRVRSDALRTSEYGSTTGSSSSGRMSRDTEGNGSRESAMTSDTSARAPRTLSSSTLSAPITDLERRLSTERVMDIFTMTPKVCHSLADVVFYCFTDFWLGCILEMQTSDGFPKSIIYSKNSVLHGRDHSFHATVYRH